MDLDFAILDRMDFLVSDVIKKWAIQTNLNTTYFESITSTNDYAKQMEFNTPTLIFADYQTKGKGRGKTWTSPSSGTSFQGSYVFLSKQNIYPILSPLVGLKLYEAFCQVWSPHKKHFYLKPPNDIYFDKLKISGLLIESLNHKDKNQIIIGVGINIFSKPNLKTAGMLKEFINPITKSDITKLLTLKFNGFKEAIEDALSPTLSPLIRKKLISGLQNNPENKYVDVLEDGSLILDTGQKKNFIDI